MIRSNVTELLAKIEEEPPDNFLDRPLIDPIESNATFQKIKKILVSDVSMLIPCSLFIEQLQARITDAKLNAMFSPEVVASIKEAARKKAESK